jgi:hypothetical protein
VRTTQKAAEQKRRLLPMAFKHSIMEVVCEMLIVAHQSA